MVWDFLINKSQLGDANLEVRSEVPDAGPGQTVLEVESFALTANNITYAAMGDSLGYWQFFPVEQQGFGKIPVWGHARVLQTTRNDIAVGQRVFGYLPMASHWVADLVPQGSGFVDMAAHRQALPPTYNRYETAGEDSAQDDFKSLLRPLLVTSWLLDDMLTEPPFSDADQVVLSSASSKTALGLAWLLKQRGIPVLGLTSVGRLAAVESLGLYTSVVAQDQVAGFPLVGTVYVDFAGNPAVTASVHRHFSEHLQASIIVGVTHWDAERASNQGQLPGPPPTLFFAPDRIRRIIEAEGPAAFGSRFGDVMTRFIADNRWLKLETARGHEGLAEVYQRVLSGKAHPQIGNIIRP